jgi:F0F1-type ATP synthase membrane subunit c/vacuolar-type H+-ATPase subunit K
MTVYGAFCGFFLAGLPVLFAASEPSFWRFLAEMGDVLALGMAATGSAIGIGLAGQAAAGAWAKEARAGRNLSFTYIILVGMPISQTLYAMIVMNNMRGVFSNMEVTPPRPVAAWASDSPPGWAKCFRPGCKA